MKVKSSQILKKAKTFLANYPNTINKTLHICTAILYARHYFVNFDDTEKKSEALIQYILYALRVVDPGWVVDPGGSYGSYRGWLEHNYPEFYEKHKNNIQPGRHQWLDAMIIYYESLGD